MSLFHGSRGPPPPLQEATTASEQPAPDQPAEVPVQGASVHLVGPQSQPMWAMSTSFAPPSGAGDAAKDRFSMVTTPRILELDVNRMLIGQNTVRWVRRRPIKEISSETPSRIFFPILGHFRNLL